MRKQPIAMIFAGALLCSCVAKLQGPALDHAAQAQRILDDCREHRQVGDETVASGHACTVEALEMNAKQALCLHAISSLKECRGD